jgi:hypothetical protein
LTHSGRPTVTNSVSTQPFGDLQKKSGQPPSHPPPHPHNHPTAMNTNLTNEQVEELTRLLADREAPTSNSFKQTLKDAAFSHFCHQNAEAIATTLLSTRSELAEVKGELEKSIKDHIVVRGRLASYMHFLEENLSTLTSERDALRASNSALGKLLSGIVCQQCANTGIINYPEVIAGPPWEPCAWCERRKEALSSTPPASVSPWRPIEEAPEVKGQYYFCRLAWGPDDDKNTSDGFRWNGRWFAAPVFHVGGPHDGCQFAMRQTEVFPTHFMENPPSPTQTGEQQS